MLLARPLFATALRVVGIAALALALGPIVIDEALLPASGAVPVRAAADGSADEAPDEMVAALMAIPDSSELDAPVLWSGSVEDAGGTPATGWVSVTARPSQLVGSSAPGTSMMPAGRAKIDSSGRFVLRVPMSSDLRSFEEEGGWITFQLFANTDQGVTLSTDSFQYVDGQWSTAPGATPDAESEAGAGGAIPGDTEASAGDALEGEHPTTLVVAPTPSSEAAVRSATKASPLGPTPPGLCSYGGGAGDAVSLGTHYVGVTEMNLAPNWSGRVVYRNTASSSIGIGYSGTAGGTYTSSGSISRSQYVSASQSVPVSGEGRKEVRAQLLWYRFRWHCYVGGGQYSYTYTEEFQSWAGGIIVVSSGAVPVCRNQSYVEPGGTFTRAKGSSESFNSSGSVGGSFSPSVSASFSVSKGSQSANDIDLSYTNNGSNRRVLCGATGPITGATRIVAMK